MRRDNRSFHCNVKIVLHFVALLCAASVLAEDPPAPPLGERAEKLIKDAMPQCSEKVTITKVGLQHKLPVNMTGNVIRVDSERQTCAGQWVAIVSREGGFYLGVPWFIDGEGAPEVKL